MQFKNLAVLLPLTSFFACSTTSSHRQPGAVIQDPLALSRVELYRNGVGYFERIGKVEGNLLTLKVRKDQINDLLKSLTVIDKSSGKVLSVSLPLDPQTWQNIAQADFTRGESGLGKILQSMRGSQVVIRYKANETQAEAEVAGRIAMVQTGENQPQLGLLQGETMHMVPQIGMITAFTLVDQDISLQLHRNLDAAMGEGMFQQVEVSVRLSEGQGHDLQVSYVVEAPKWKPTYRLVLDSRDSSQALLQSWAVVDNISGESWNNVQLNLTSGAPIAFRYNLHTPQMVGRPDMTRNQTDRQVEVAIERASNSAKGMVGGVGYGSSARSAKAAAPSQMQLGDVNVEGYLDNPSAVFVLEDESMASSASPSQADREFFNAVAQSTAANTSALRVSGLTQYQLQDKVTLPNGTASMVALVNQKVPGREFFLYQPGGSGRGYEHNPYRVVRFQNSTPFALEPGPLSVYTDGHFVGEGITDVVGAAAVSTIPFAVESGITIQYNNENEQGEHRLVKIVKGILYTETFDRYITRWQVKGAQEGRAYTVMVKQNKRGGNYRLQSKHEGIEDNPDYWMLPVQVPAGKDSMEVSVVEETPRTARFAMLDDPSIPQMLGDYLKIGKATPGVLKALQPIVAKRQEMSDIQQKVRILEEQQNQYDTRLRELRGNLAAIAKDKLAEDLRNKMNKDLLEFTEKTNAMGRQIVELKDRQLVLKIELQELLKDFTLEGL